jgi:hypothetical protein
MNHKRNLYLILIIFAVSFIISIIIIFSENNKKFHYYHNENFSPKSWKYGTPKEEFREFSRWYK